MSLLESDEVARRRPSPLSDRRVRAGPHADSGEKASYGSCYFFLFNAGIKEHTHFLKRSSSVSSHVYTHTYTHTCMHTHSSICVNRAGEHCHLSHLPWRRMSGGSGEDTEAEHLRFRAELLLSPNLLLFSPNLGVHRTVSNPFFFFFS